MIEYVVQKYDTIAAVRERFKVSWEQIKQQNPHAVGRMQDSGRWFLKEGARLRFESAVSESDTVTFEEQLERSSLRQHKVRAGDTLWDLSRAYGVEVETIAGLNGLKNPNLIRVGQLLTIPLDCADSGNEPSSRERPSSDAVETKVTEEKTDLQAADSGDEALLEALAGDIMPMPLYTGRLSIEEQPREASNSAVNAAAEERTSSEDKASPEALSLAYVDSQKPGVDPPQDRVSETSSRRFSVTTPHQDDPIRNRIRIQYSPAENTKLFLGLDFERYGKSSYVDKENDLDLSVLVGISLDF